MRHNRLVCALFLTLLATDASAEALVKDGDDLIIEGQDYRLFGVDAFEEGQICKDDAHQEYDCGKRAKAALEQLIEGKSVRCTKVYKRGKRDIANCVANDVDVGLALIREGWAFTRPDFLKQRPAREIELCSAEKEAREAKRGAWIGSFVVPFAQKSHKRLIAEVVCKDSPLAEVTPTATRPEAATVGGPDLTAQQFESVIPPNDPVVQAHSDDLPAWVRYLTALSTPAIGLLAAVIAIGQWRVVRRREVMELFDRRMEVYAGISRVIGEVVGSGSVTNQTASAFGRATSNVDLLFGGEVKAYLDRMNNALSAHHVAEAAEQHGTAEQRQAALDRRHQAFLTIASYFNDYPKLMKPYLSMHQKTPRSLMDRLRG